MISITDSQRIAFITTIQRQLVVCSFMLLIIVHEVINASSVMILSQKKSYKNSNEYTKKLNWKRNRFVFVSELIIQTMPVEVAKAMMEEEPKVEAPTLSFEDIPTIMPPIITMDNNNKEEKPTEVESEEDDEYY